MVEAPVPQPGPYPTRPLLSPTIIRLADMQLEILWEEIMKRFENIEVVGEPIRIRSSFVKGFSHLPVIIR